MTRARVNRVLVVQTAFIGDVILTLPLVEQAHDFFRPADVDMVVVPRAADVCRNHPDLHDLVIYDKRGADRGVRGFIKLIRLLRSRQYDLALVPHRSLRSALLVALSGIPLRVGFRTLAGRLFFTRSIPRRSDLHEAERNLSLLAGVGIRDVPLSLPHVHPSSQDEEQVRRFLSTIGVQDNTPVAAIAPGTVWNTKRWPHERYVALAGLMAQAGFHVLIIGGPEDEELSRQIAELGDNPRVHSVAGPLSLLQSAEVIRRSRILVANDSAPVHLAVAVGTPVVAIFGATIPAFGFAPYGPHDSIVEVRGLSCRPCSAHGGDNCPIKTFECMLTITPERVWNRVQDVMRKAEKSGQN